MTDQTVTQHHITFESIKQDHNGNEYWNAHDLARILGYSEYRHFVPVIKRAKEACINSGHKSVDHYEEVLEMVNIRGNLPRRYCYFNSKA